MSEALRAQRPIRLFERGSIFFGKQEQMVASTIVAAALANVSQRHKLVQCRRATSIRMQITQLQIGPLPIAKYAFSSRFEVYLPILLRYLFDHLPQRSK